LHGTVTCGNKNKGPYDQQIPRSNDILKNPAPASPVPMTIDRNPIFEYTECNGPIHGLRGGD